MRCHAVLLAMVALCSWACAGLAQEPSMRSAIERLQQSLQQRDANIERLAGDLFPESDQASLTEKLKQCREMTVGGEVADVILENRRGTIVLETSSGPVTVQFGLSSSAPYQVTSLTATRAEQDLRPITWDSLEDELNVAAKNGFNGAVLLTRHGEIAFHKAFGLANREKQIENKPDTVFAIGSAPIDFTHASILLLREDGKLTLDDPITQYFKDVPADKQTITIRHLMTGQSGLPDFHDLPSDREPDHSWIDRDEAVRRIMNQRLLFEPGAGSQHSHSAWGLLAAIVETVSHQSYEDFTQSRLYDPAGMKDTGFFGDKIDEARIAVGYGSRKSADPNSPPHWGKTSWLVMGSGGQVSTLMDMYQWEVAIREGKVLNAESTKEFVGDNRRVSADGDMYGFEFMHSHNPECMFMIISNSINSPEDRQRFSELARRLHRLVENELNSNPYSIGIAMEFDADSQRVVVAEVADGSPAAEAGMQRGDALLSANEVPFGDPREVLAKYLTSGESIEFVVLRNNERIKVTVQPSLRK